MFGFVHGVFKKWKEASGNLDFKLCSGTVANIKDWLGMLKGMDHIHAIIVRGVGII